MRILSPTRIQEAGLEMERARHHHLGVGEYPIAVYYVNITELTPAEKNYKGGSVTDFIEGIRRGQVKKRGNVIMKRAIFSTYAEPSEGSTEALFTTWVSGLREPLRARLSLSHRYPSLRFLGFDGADGQLLPVPKLSESQLDEFQSKFQETLIRNSL